MKKLKIITASAFAVLLFFHPTLGNADSKNPLIWETIEKGTMVSIQTYNKADDTYHIVVIEESAVGPLMSTSEDVAKAINYPEPARLKKNPSLIVGNQYQLNIELPTLSLKGLAERKKAVEKKAAERKN